MFEGGAEGRSGGSARPFALGYAERRPLDERRGRYDEADEVWVIDDGTAKMPLVRSRAAAPEDDAMLCGVDATVTSRQVVVDESISSVTADPTDPPKPRRAGDGGDSAGAARSNQRLALDETVTKNAADPSDVSRPRRGGLARAGKPRPVPDETLTFTRESTDESRPRRSGF